MVTVPVTALQSKNGSMAPESDYNVFAAAVPKPSWEIAAVSYQIQAKDHLHLIPYEAIQALAASMKHYVYKR